MSEITRSEIEAFLYYEARLLDDRKFEEWLECYREDAEFGCQPGTTTVN